MMKSACVFGKSAPNQAHVNIEEGMRDASSKIAVQFDNEYVTRDKLMKYFGRTGNGGGDIKSVIYPYEYKGRKVAVIEFEDIKCAESLNKKRQAFIAVRGNETVTLHIEKFEELMHKGSIDLNRSLYEGVKSTSSEAIDEIIEECDVEINEDACVIEGEWYKLVHAKKMFDALILFNQSKFTLHSVAKPIDSPSDTKTNFLLFWLVILILFFFMAICFFGVVFFAAVEKSFQVDHHLLRYIKMTDADSELIQMIKECDIQEEAGSDTVTLIFPEALLTDVAKCRKKRIKDMLEDKKRSSVQKVFGIVGYNDNQINQRIEAVHREFPRTVYVSKMNKDSVTFIGPTRDICNDAWSTFQSAKFDEPTMNSYCATKNQDNYCELNCYKFCDNKLIMRVLQGDIVDQSTTAIVNAANEHLHGGGGVTGAIYHAGGQEFQRHCVEVMRKRDYQPMGIGEVLATEACGRLICKSVLHAVAPKYYECEGDADCQYKMYLTCYSIFAMADSMQFKSVSIPAMGTGIYGVPIPVFCKALVKSIKEICEGISKDKIKYLKEIRLVNYDEDEASRIASTLSQELENDFGFSASGDVVAW